MNKITQNRPVFFERFKDQEAEFSTLDELLSIPFVKYFSDCPDFFRFSLSGRSLMAERKNGEFWGVGLIETPIEGLPKWRHPNA